MTRYIVRRVLWLIPVLVFVSLITFTLMHITPGGPWDKDKAVSAQAVANLNAKYNLDKPAWQQYLLYMSNAVRGDLGPSYTYQDRSVTQIILGGLPNTTSLGFFAALVAVLVGIPLGVIAATRQNSVVDYSALAFGTVFASVPSFVLGFVMIILFALTRYVSVASVAASFALPFASWLTGHSLLLIIVTGCMGALAIYKHRANIKRLLNGTESRFRGTKSKQPEAAHQENPS